ncbi:phage tail tape measure protein [Tenacibaculum sp. 47A_GOM-205m]|uniref:phage tail tape measure protein n=1 Tax=Tenacibaculum sp. 47A_GOM-205m TaxID=1380384 RepID=UPI00048BDE2F|nr:phage tail tape measure protein [Tenacibaculum sp. 47A_GOM-205m]
MAKDTKFNLTIKINGKEVANTLNGVGNEIRTLKKELRKLNENDPKFEQKQKELQKARERYDELNNSINGTNDVLDEARGHWDNLLGGLISGNYEMASKGLQGITTNIKGITKAAWAFITTPLGATLATLGGIAAITKRWVGYNVELYKTTELTRTLTGLSGEALEELRDKVSGTAKTFDLEYNDVLKSSNSLAKQMKISHKEAIDLITQGLARGANINGDFLDKLKEYPVQFKNAGFSAQDFIDIATQEVKGGVYSDKLVDTLKEADLALKEMTKTQTEALQNAFGEKFTQELAKGIKTGEITTKEAIFRIIKEADALGLNLQQKQQLIADVFKGAGEDAGGFSEIVLQLNESFKEQNKQLTENEAATLRLAEANQSVNTELEDLFDASQSGFPSMLKHIQAVGKETFANLLRGLKLATTSLKQMISVAKEEGATAAANDVVEDMKRFNSSQEDAIKYRLESTQKNIDRVKKQMEDLSFTGKLLGTDKTLNAQLSKYIAYKDELLNIASDTSTKFKAIEATYINPDDPIDNNVSGGNSGGNSDEKGDEEKLTKEDKRILESKKKLAEFLKEFDEEQKILKQIKDLEEDEAAQLEEELRLEARYAKLEADAVNEKELLARLAEAKKTELQAIEDKYDKIKADKDKKNKAKELKRDQEQAKKKLLERRKLKNDIINGAISLAGEETRVGQALVAAKGVLAAKESLIQLGVLKTKAASAVAEGTMATSVGAANTAKVGFPQNIPLLIGFAAQAVGIISAIKKATSLAKSSNGFFKGGYTGNKALYHDGQDGVVGPAHIGEWYAPKWMNKDPRYAPTIQWLEKERKNPTNNGFFDGGHTTPEEVSEYNEAPTTYSDKGESDTLLTSLLNRLVNLLENGIEASALIGDDNIEQFRDREEKLNKSRENAKIQ